MLTDQQVLDRVRSQTREGSLVGRTLLLMFLSGEGLQLPAVVAIEDTPEWPDAELAVSLCQVIASVLADAAPDGSVVLTLSRPGPRTADDADRAWFHAIRRAAAEASVQVRMTCLATASGVRQLTL
jgi:hypothetical protein